MFEVIIRSYVVKTLRINYRIINTHYPNGLNDILIKKSIIYTWKGYIKEKLGLCGRRPQKIFESSKSDHKFENWVKLGPNTSRKFVLGVNHPPCTTS